MSDAISRLRQRLNEKLSELERILKPAFEHDPLFPGALYLSRHRCGKPHCRCSTSGELHRALRLQIRFRDGIANRCRSEEEAAFWRPRTEAYQGLREAERSFRRWQKDVLELLDAIEHARCSTEGLDQDDRRRPLR
jgi:hypothetical protein